MESGKKFYKRPIFITLIIALLIAVVAGPKTLALKERQAKNLDVQVEAEEVWGEAVEGVQVRLRAKGETTAKRVTLLVDARNDGPGTYRGTRSTHGCWLKVDGKWYGRISSHEIVLSMLLKPGDRKLALTRLHLSAEKSPLWRGGFITRNGQVPSLGAREIHQSEPLELSPGRHTVRLAFPASRKAYAYSKPVEIEILPEQNPDVQVEVKRSPDEGHVIWGEIVDGLQVGISLKRKVYYLNVNDPEPVHWQIKNTSQEDKAILWQETDYSPVFFEIGKTDEKKHLTDGRLDNWGYPKQPEKILLRPGEVKKATFDLRFFKLWYGIDPKTYEITALYSPRDNHNLRLWLEDKQQKYKDIVMSRISSGPVRIITMRDALTNSDVQVEAEEIEKKNSLVWGKEVNGLRVAVEFVPEKESYDLEERVGVRFHIQNVSNEDVQFRSMSGRQYWPTVKDSDGKEVKVDTWESLGTWSYLHHIIKPGQTFKLKNTGLIFSDFHDSALLDKPKWVGIAGVVRCGPGQYSIYYKLNRTLETGVRKVTVNERPPVNPRSFELTLDQQSMLQAIQTLRHKYRVRICFEQASSESGSKQHLLTGTFFAPTIPELLDKLTETSLYKWEKFYLTYAVYPKQNSLLRFSVNTDISESPLESVARVILDQNPRGEQIEIEAVYKGRMRRRLWISRASAMYALSGATARAGIRNSDVVWTLTPNQGVPRLYLHRLSQALQTNEQIKADIPDGKNQLVWGEPIEGVQVRLRAEKDMWEAEEKPIFKADIRNRGELELYVHAADEFCQLEIDGVWYGWYGPWGLIGVKQSPLGPGNQINNISISLAKKWGGPRKALNLTAGMHTVRIAFILQRAEQNNQGLVRVVSNPVEIKILPAKTDMQAEAEGEGEKPMLVWGDQVNGLRAAVESTAGR